MWSWLRGLHARHFFRSAALFGLEASYGRCHCLQSTHHLRAWIEARWHAQSADMSAQTASPSVSTKEKIAAATHGLHQPLSTDKNLCPAKFILTEKALDQAFNDIWANNANAISHCYSNTDALKVDFTRTGKRSFLGMINDATNSVYRMVQGAVTDFFRQTVLDFTYGSIGLQGLEKYYDDLNSRDPSESIRLARIRASAIESCQSQVVPESELLIGGWTLCSPLQANTVQALKLEEKVVLLTAKALYACSYDFGSEKLNEFTKVLVGDIIGIQQGKSAWRHLVLLLPSSHTDNRVLSAPWPDNMAPHRPLRHLSSRILPSARQLGLCHNLSKFRFS